MGVVTELWDLYDENRCLLNKTIIRGNIFDENNYHIVVGVWIVNSYGQILLTLRHPKKETYPTLWENTGGSVLAGESSADGAMRELKEEIGLSVEKNELKLLGTIKGNHNFVDLYLLKKDIKISDIQLQEEETVDVKWVTSDELLKMIDKGEVAHPIQERFMVFYEKIIEEILQKSTQS